MNLASPTSSGARFNRLAQIFGVGVALAVLSGCAQKLRMEPTFMVPEKMVEAPRLLQATATGSSSAGYARTLKSETRWLKIGTIRQGDVLKPLDITLTAEAGHVREAYIVVNDNRWVGFWLPVEQAFSPLNAVTPISFYKGV